MKTKTNDTCWLIWCHERNQYWKAGSNGYTSSLKEAGRYSFEDATQICHEANRNWMGGRNGYRPEESICPEPDEK